MPVLRFPALLSPIWQVSTLYYIQETFLHKTRGREKSDTMQKTRETLGDFLPLLFFECSIFALEKKKKAVEVSAYKCENVSYCIQLLHLRSYLKRGGGGITFLSQQPRDFSPSPERPCTCTCRSRRGSCEPKKSCQRQFSFSSVLVGGETLLCPCVIISDFGPAAPFPVSFPQWRPWPPSPPRARSTTSSQSV